MRRMLLVLALFSAMAVLIGSGCGGGDGGDGTTASTAGGDTTSAAGSDESADSREAAKKQRSAAEHEGSAADPGSAPEKKESASEGGKSGEDQGSAPESQNSTPGSGTSGAGDSEGSADDKPEATSSITRAEYVKQGNSACDRIQKKMGKEFEVFMAELNDKGISPTKAEAQKIIARVAIPAMKEQISELSALPAPSGDEEEVELIVTRQEETLKKIEAEPLFRTSRAYKKLNKPASDYGLTRCAT